MAPQVRRPFAALLVVLLTLVGTGILSTVGGFARAQESTPRPQLGNTLVATNLQAGTPEPTSEQDVRYRSVNVELILDSSGSMAETLEGGQTRIDAAKQVLNQVIDALPEQ